ncbi:precorrin-6y C5,15-methyltransferase (decarboxylating) subunit CbiE [Allokutzneria sp. A3M-2-11 16]|uniref:precorrin-6y C5,15-methyltransferase (decarboxylating) subunit CbiE n=1 Tax=Allokutzneria sp. A3M-2-11 16 TaxID=2962043 RepID=UPI0020B7F31D|nr:precorrin-6y C5,15-methyltransferase (decarboxylating) subunit CbiE [Allokutzneria sp. A3M-2-11 16]MCP3802539.1 precorrin-6y C5,15-methyltransferase (decarboxylating) subunit CbiE [Allokutzneria sp. A3M-2-11 16]
MEADFVSVVGIGADGWDGLPESARRLVLGADVLFGSTRQLALVPGHAQRVSWPSPLLPALPGLLDANRGKAICVLASGDPMFFGIGSTLARLIGPERLRVVPHPSSVSLACARLGWPLDEVEVITAVGRPVESVNAAIHPGRRVMVLSADGGTPAEVAELLTDRGYGASTMTVLEHLGGPEERKISSTAADWHEKCGALNVIAVECAGPKLSSVPGLPDDAYEHDGQLTKREVRAVTLAMLAPVPGELLWDVGAGAGSIAIEWSRAHPSCRAIAIEKDPERAERIVDNAKRLGVPSIRVVRGAVPDALPDERPDAVFIGGGVTVPGVVERCFEALKPSGRLVANAVTVESEAVLARWHAELGGELVRLAVSRGSPVGGFTGWRAMMPVTILIATKGEPT